MNKEQFIKTAVKSGYGSEDAARKYTEANDKPEYGTDDFIVLYHSRPNCMHWDGCAPDKGLRLVFGMHGKTTAMSSGGAQNDE